MQLFKQGVSVKELIKHLRALDQDIPVLLCSDEEKNTVYKGIYLQDYADGVYLAGLSGCEDEEDYQSP